MRLLIVAALMVAAVPTLVPSRAAAQATAERPAALNRLVECRAIGDAAQRLACYDTAAEALDSAERQGEVVVVDRGQLREARRGLFGFDLPSMPSFLSRGEAEERIEAVETTLVRASQSGDGKWTFVLADGSTWRQVDSAPVRFRNREGMPVRIRRASLGSYQLLVDGSRAVRARRQ